MCQAVGADLAQDVVSGADALETIQHKGVVQVLLAESNHSVVGIQQIGDDDVPVIVPINIFHSEDGICLVLRQDGHNRGILAKEKDCRQGDALEPSFSILQN